MRKTVKCKVAGLLLECHVLHTPPANLHQHVNAQVTIRWLQHAINAAPILSLIVWMQLQT